MLITFALFEAYLKCPTKCLLRSQGEQGAENAYAEWIRMKGESYRGNGVQRRREGMPREECTDRLPSTKALGAATWRLALDVRVVSPDCESTLEAVERTSPAQRNESPNSFRFDSYSITSSPWMTSYLSPSTSPCSRRNLDARLAWGRSFTGAGTPRIK